MTELNVPPWAFITIWMTLIIGAALAGWFLRGFWNKDNNPPPHPPEDDRGMGGKRGKR